MSLALCAGRNFKAGGILAGHTDAESYLREFAMTREEFPATADSQWRNALFNGFPVCSIHDHQPMPRHIILILESIWQGREPDVIRRNDLSHEFVV